MTDEAFDRYLKDRCEHELKWYEDRSARNKRIYYWVQSIVIGLAAVTPAFAGTGLAKTGEHVWAIWLTMVCSILVAIGTALLKTFKYQETWLNYRTTAETLKKEKVQYDTETGDYVGLEKPEDRRALFVERVEAVISRENTLWLSTQRKKDKEKKQE
ncbi:MAG: DUF4231 domain-containing protein [candidate division WOR-3 bacterium]|nr:MAG: DUF4231 domain-containing protein [candidate division WOR-3 bacterium]